MEELLKRSLDQLDQLLISIEMLILGSSLVNSESSRNLMLENSRCWFNKLEQSKECQLNLLFTYNNNNSNHPILNSNRSRLTINLSIKWDHYREEWQISNRTKNKNLVLLIKVIQSVVLLTWLVHLLLMFLKIWTWINQLAAIWKR